MPDTVLTAAGDRLAMRIFWRRGVERRLPGTDGFLMEASLDDGEVIVQTRRSAKVINMIQKFIHKTSLAFGQRC